MQISGTIMVKLQNKNDSQSKEEKMDKKQKFSRPKIVISKCLGFAYCRYNGLTINSDVVSALKNYVEFLPVCPEVEIGLGIPRDPIRIVSDDEGLKLMQPSINLDVTEKMNKFAESHLNSLKEIDGFILKHRSPSCGISDVKVFPGLDKVSPIKKKSGFFGAMVLELYSNIPIEDEGRLTNFRIREHFFIRIFINIRFREIKTRQTMKDLVNFHSQYKLLLMAYNQKEMSLMGKIVANHEKRPVAEVIQNYQQHLFSAFSRPARLASNINVLMHGMGYFSKQLKHEEKAFFLDALEEYREGKIPLSVPNTLLKSWIVRFEEPYLMQQSFFEPYPLELVEISDSGKGRNF